MQIVLASNNSGKLRELRSLFAQDPQLAKVQLLGAGELDLPPVVEDGTTFESNAKKKALSAARATGKISLADDSGLEVDALGGKPGVQSARFASEGENQDARNNAKLLAELEGIPPCKRTARFCSIVAIATPQGQVWLTEGSCQGAIATEAKGKGGFGYDPLFLVAGTDQTMAQLSEAEKNKISHRAVAFTKALPILKKLCFQADHA